jgi:sugar-specific transcriptional regulator TrmB
MSYLERELQKIGFSDKETKVYLAGIELGPSTAQELSKKSGVNRATTYVMIESLTERGLMGSFLKGKKRFFTAESPEHILILVKEEKRKIEDKENTVLTLLEDLKSLTNIKDQPNVTFFEGEKGIEKMRSAVLESSEEVIEEFSPIDEVYKYFPSSENDHRENIRKQFEIKIIYTSKDGPVFLEKEDGVERRFIPSDLFPFRGDIAIHGSKVSIIYYTPKLVGVLIDHEGISETFRNMFRLAWVGAETFKKNKRG